MTELPASAAGVRLGTPADLDAIFALQQSAPECAQWQRATYAEILTATPEANPQRRVFCVQRGGHVAGFAVASLLRAAHTGVCELENMAVAPADRRLGVGRMLVAAVLTWSQQQRAESVHLEVRAANGAAVQLYERLGFVAVGRRPAYYSHPVDDAVQMTWMAGGGGALSC